MADAPTNGGAVLVRLDHLEESRDDHEQRLRFLERAHWRMAGIVAAVAALASLAGGYLGSNGSGASAASSKPAAVETRGAP